ncbi:AAA family ATPase [Helicobacter cinaedi]|uniref:AAA family ATPase n=1 Tax=Helicobacter cinaedi TaxID=213 RepID=UPI000CF1A5A4|nr:AAA family ATPase [Helicobacter cinaedi]
MKIHIKNIGMLDEAEFEIGDLTLICGENNTGKTYATYSLYGYLDFMGNGINPAFFEVIRNVIKKYSEFIDIHECAAIVNLS